MRTKPDEDCSTLDENLLCTFENKLEEGCYADGGMNGNIIL